MQQTLLDVLAGTRRRDPGRPVVTFYDDATGERIELSLTTFDNWVCKIANLFADDLGLEPGDRLVVDLPTHWLGPVVVVAGWTAGLVLVHPADVHGPDVRVVGPSAVTDPGEPSANAATVACSLRPLGGRFVEPLPSGWLDFAVEVPPQPDALVVAHAPGTGDPAVATPHASITMGELLERGLEQASAIGLAAGGRIATDLNPCDPATFATSLLAPLAVGASVVLVVNASPDRRTTIVEEERATSTIWADRSGLPA